MLFILLIQFVQVRIKFGRFFLKALRLAEFHSDIVEAKYGFLKWLSLTFFEVMLLLSLVLGSLSNNVSTQANTNGTFHWMYCKNENLNSRNSFSDDVSLVAPTNTRLAAPVIARLVLYLVDLSFSWKEEF